MARPGYDREVPTRLRVALRHAAGQLETVRDKAGTSLVAVLCASAFAPLLTTAGVSSPVALACVGIAGNVGAEVLAGLAGQAIAAVRGEDGEGEEATDLRAVRDELAVRLETALSRDDDLGAALRDATAQLLRETHVTASIAAYLAEAEVCHSAHLSAELVTLGERFDEFAFIHEEVRAAVNGLQSCLTDSRIRQRAATEQLHEQNLLLTEIRDCIRLLRSETGSSPSAAE